MSKQTLSIEPRKKNSITNEPWHAEGRAVFDSRGHLIAVAANAEDAKVMAAAPTFGGYLDLLRDRRRRTSDVYGLGARFWALVRSVLIDSGFYPDCPEFDQDTDELEPEACS
jgi:hypothetical protein